MSVSVGALVGREFEKYLESRKLSAENVSFAVNAVGEFEEYLKKRGMSLGSLSLDAIKDYVSLLIEEGKNSRDRLVAIARYCDFAKKNNCFIYFASILGARNVLPDIGERLGTIAGEEVQRRVCEGFELPPLGSPPESYPMLTKRLVDGMEAELSGEMCREVLTWNYHKVPRETFKGHKERFEKAKSVDEYLKGEHRRFVEELTSYMKAGRIWYEQEITPEVVKFVEGNPEIQNGVRHGDRIYVSKIPFAPSQFLVEKDPVMKRFYACHCPLVRTAIRDGAPGISPIFCYCSAGFEKLHFDVIFDEPVEVELLESVLKGDLRCRFAIRIPRGKMK